MIRSQLEFYSVLDILTRLAKQTVIYKFKQIFLEVVGRCLSLVIIKSIYGSIQAVCWNEVVL